MAQPLSYAVILKTRGDAALLECIESKYDSALRTVAINTDMAHAANLLFKIAIKHGVKINSAFLL